MIKCKTCHKQFREYKRNGIILSRYCLDCRNKKALKEKKRIKKLKLAERKKKKREAKQNTNKYWGKKCWIAFTKFLKKERANFQGYAQCYTCGKQFKIKQLQCGHCFHRGRGGWRAIDFNPQHIQLQCPACNINGGGKIPIFTANLIRDFGWEFYQELERGAVKPALSVDELKEIYKSL